LLVALNPQYLIPFERTCQIFADLFGQAILEGTLASAVNCCAAEVVEVEATIKAGIAQASVGHFDETGLAVADTREWLHVASTPSLTHYAHYPQRGAAATTDLGILPRFTGTAVHDGWRAYRRYDCQHGLCNAHHLRELTFIEEQIGQPWAGQMKQLLVEIKAGVEEGKRTGQTALARAILESYEHRYQAILEAGFETEKTAEPLATGKRGRKKQSKAKNLLDRLDQYR
jgi:transposase